MGTLNLILEPTHLSALLVEATRWSDRITLCLSAPNSEHGGVPVWRELLDARPKYESVIIHGAASAEAWLLHRLHETGAMRLTTAEGQRFESQLLRFRRDDEVRLFLAHVPLARSAMETDCGSVAYFQGLVGSDFAASALRLTEEWRERSRVPTGSELDGLAATSWERAAAPSLTTSPMVVVSEAGELTALAGELLRALRADAAGDGPAEGSVFELPAEGHSLELTVAAGDVVSLTTLASGFRLGLDATSGERAVVLTIVTGAGLASGNGLLLRNAGGRVARLARRFTRCLATEERDALGTVPPANDRAE